MEHQITLPSAAGLAGLLDPKFYLWAMYSRRFLKAGRPPADLSAVAASKGLPQAAGVGWR
jgi:hypothetical protein